MLNKVGPAPTMPGIGAHGANASQPFHLIIDDASHWPPDTIASFEFLFLHGLRPGGVYAVEDVSTSYDQFNGYKLYNNLFEGMGRTSERSVVNYFREMAHLVNRKWDRSRSSPQYSHTYRNEAGAREPSTHVSSWVSMVTFGQGIIIVTKQTAEEHRKFKYICKSPGALDPAGGYKTPVC